MGTVGWALCNTGKENPSSELGGNTERQHPVVWRGLIKSEILEA